MRAFLAVLLASVFAVPNVTAQTAVLRPVEPEVRILAITGSNEIANVQPAGALYDTLER